MEWPTVSILTVVTDKCGTGCSLCWFFYTRCFLGCRTFYDRFVIPSHHACISWIWLVIKQRHKCFFNNKNMSWNQTIHFPPCVQADQSTSLQCILLYRSFGVRTDSGFTSLLTEHFSLLVIVRIPPTGLYLPGLPGFNCSSWARQFYIHHPLHPWALWVHVSSQWTMRPSRTSLGKASVLNVQYMLTSYLLIHFSGYKICPPTHLSRDSLTKERNKGVTFPKHFWHLVRCEV